MNGITQEQRIAKLSASIGIAIEETAKETGGTLTTSEVVNVLLRTAYGYNKNQMLSEVPKEEMIFDSSMNEMQVVTEKDPQEHEEKHL